MHTQDDQYWMQIALQEAMKAEEEGEVPIGACLISRDGDLLSAAHNRVIGDSDPTAHAEILVLREAAKKIGNHRLLNTTLYTTIEPCVMCAGALVHARIERLVFAAHDERFGAVETIFQLCNSPLLNHRLEITSGVLAEESRQIIKKFFLRLRLEKRNHTD
jgi:tRNA(adenine34) deaminase